METNTLSLSFSPNLLQLSFFVVSMSLDSISMVILLLLNWFDSSLSLPLAQTNSDGKHPQTHRLTRLNLKSICLPLSLSFLVHSLRSAHLLSSSFLRCSSFDIWRQNCDSLAKRRLRQRVQPSTGLRPTVYRYTRITFIIIIIRSIVVVVVHKCPQT
jgi:hypothetical protein